MLSGAACRYADGVWPNRLALAYVVGGQATALALFAAAPAWGARLVGVLLAAHSLPIATYLVHECIHESIFRDKRRNARLGAALAWLAGGGAAGYERLRRKHLHHHLDRVDPSAFDHHAVFAAHPTTHLAIVALEWLHVPALDLLLRAVPAWRALRRPAFAAERGRVAGALATRLAGAAALLALGGSVLASYAVAYLLFVVAARFFDAFHHTFDVVVMADFGLDFGPEPDKDRAYEPANTYSNLLPRRWTALNLLVLNFTYHNAHHRKPGVPWHRLRALDAQLFGADARQVVPARWLLADFHALRLARLAGQPGAGAVAVSLLTV